LGDAGGLIKKAPLTGEMPEGLGYQLGSKISTWKKLSHDLFMPRIYGAS
jgi:hypothetical protein